MKTTARFVSVPRPCSYLRDRLARMEYEVVARMEPDEYLERLRCGWRRFGRTLFRPRCPGCSECRSLRIDVRRFRPDRGMRRVRARNLGEIELSIVPAAGPPDPEVLDLYRRYHREQAARRGWPDHEDVDPDEFAESFLDNPFPTEQWRYRLAGLLVGVGFVDVVPGALSAIYFIYDHDRLDRSPGTWNILCMIDRAAEQDLEHVYLGYYVADCRSLAYKSRFRPHERREADGTWADSEPEGETL